MKFLLNLYPPAWQRRYRREVEAHLAEEPFRVGTAASLFAGAVDAWMYPQWIPTAQEPEGEPAMTKSTRYGQLVFCEDKAPESAGLMIGVSLVVTVVAVVLDRTLGDHMAIDALLLSAFFIALTIASAPQMKVQLKAYSRLAKAALVAACCVGWYAFFLTVLAVANAA